jgi:hypothetical protein
MSDLTKIRSEIDPEQVAVDQALIKLRVLVIGDETTLTWAGDLLKQAKIRVKELEDKRKEVTRPILAAKAAVDSMFKPLTERYGQAEAILKGKIAEYMRAQEEERRRMMLESAAEHAAGGTPTAIIPEPAQVQGVTMRKVWTFEIVDQNLIPRELCSPDTTKIRAAVHLGARDIPGVRIFETDNMAVRT